MHTSMINSRLRRWKPATESSDVLLDREVDADLTSGVHDTELDGYSTMIRSSLNVRVSLLLSQNARMYVYRPEAKLVLLGDSDQLPSVHAGAVFADIVAAGRDRASVELAGNYRINISRKDAAGRALAATFGAIRGGESGALLQSITTHTPSRARP